MNAVLKVILLIILTSGLLMNGCSSPIEKGEAPQIGNEEGEAPQIGNEEGEAPQIVNEEDEAPQIGKQAPNFQLQELDGQIVSLRDFLGKPVLINFWATWCSPCRSEMPYLQELYEEWSAKGLVVLTINSGESHSQVKQFMESQHLSLPVLLDTKQDVVLEYSIQYLPTTFFIDKDGIIQEKTIGAFPNKAAIEKDLDKIMP
ncbi:TlpA family protein disulfide reductase [Chloroflexota bacterium]